MNLFLLATPALDYLVLNYMTGWNHLGGVDEKQGQSKLMDGTVIRTYFD